MDAIAEIIKDKTNEIINETVRHRRHFHMHPELSFMEYKTAEYICDYLDKHDIKYSRNLAGTGIIAWVDGEKRDGNVVALRAEMDALPITEESGLEYASVNNGIMHACGHDAHMAMLMSSISIIRDIRNTFGGKIAFIFQPGEELAPGGARMIMETKNFKNLNPDLVIAQHVLPELETGMTGFRPGKYMASSDEIHIIIQGRGGHAALPQQSSEQVYIGSELVTRLKETVNNYKSREPAIIGFGRFIAEGTTNVIPEKVNIKGTLRTFDEKARMTLKILIKDLCKETGLKYGVKVDLSIPDGYPVLVNSNEYVRTAMMYAQEINGKKTVKEIDRRMSSEDFAFYSQKYPVIFYRLGIKGKTEGISGLHTPGFTIDEKAMLTGVRTMSYLGVKFTGTC